MTVELPVVPVGKNTITLPPLRSLQNLRSVSCNREAGFLPAILYESLWTVQKVGPGFRGHSVKPHKGQ